MAKSLVFLEAPRCRATVLCYAIVHGLRAQGLKVIFLDEVLHWRRLEQLQKQGKAAVCEYYQYVTAGNTQSKADWIIYKEQAKFFFHPEVNKILSQSGITLSCLEHLRNHDKHIFIIRDSVEMILSHWRCLSSATMEKTPKQLTPDVIGLEALDYVYKALLETDVFDVVIIDSDEVLLAPEARIEQMCSRLSVPFSSSMIWWEKVELTAPPWGRLWYETILKSHGLESQIRRKCFTLPRDLAPLVEKSAPIFERLHSNAFRFDD